MDLEIPYLRIRDFESQNLEKLLNKERRPDEPTIVKNKDGYATEEKSQGVFYTGDGYSKSVDLILESIGLQKYIDNFKDNDIGVNVLIHMDEDDLAEIGITDFLDQAQFRKQMRDFRGYRSQINQVCRVEEDLIMAQNICTHLEDINNHLNLLDHYLSKSNCEDYFVSPKKSILCIFKIVMDRAMVQTKKMKDVLYTGSLDSDELIPALLKADSLELPDFMLSKLYNPDKRFKVINPKYKKLIKTIKILAGLSVAFSSLAILIYKGNK